MKKLNRKQVIRAGIILLSALLALFIISRFGHLILGPRIKLDSIPKNPVTNPVIDLTGIIKGGRQLWINGTQISVEQNGKFNTQLVVPPGYTIMTLEAQDELGSRRKKEIPIYYLPLQENTAATEQSEIPDQIQLSEPINNNQ